MKTNQIGRHLGHVLHELLISQLLYGQLSPKLKKELLLKWPDVTYTPSDLLWYKLYCELTGVTRNE
jgi:hypothetical protein